MRTRGRTRRDGVSGPDSALDTDGLMTIPMETMAVVTVLQNPTSACKCPRPKGISLQTDSIIVVLCFLLGEERKVNDLRAVFLAAELIQQ